MQVERIGREVDVIEKAEVPYQAIRDFLQWVTVIVGVSALTFQVGTHRCNHLWRPTPA